MKATDIDDIPGVDARSVSLGGLLAHGKGPGRASWRDLRTSPGIYAACLGVWNTISFASGADQTRHARSADPKLLREKRRRILAAGPTDILYIGKAGGMNSHLRQLARFGMGRADNHSGGEWLWQVQWINDADLRMWSCHRSRSAPLERELLERFRSDHGDSPLANRY